jgi:hypothetical protein
MADADIHWAEYIKASSEAFALLKALYPLLPQGGSQVEASIEAAEQALQAANVTLAQMWGYKIHDCTFPPQIMLYQPETKERACPHCGFTTNFNRPLPPVNRGGGSWMSR